MSEKPISQFKKNKKAKILGLNCERAFAKRLCTLGLFEGAEVTILKNDNFGPIIIKIFNSKIAIGRGEANKIYGKEI